MHITAYHMGAAFELLAAERIDYVAIEDNSPICGALMMAGRAMQELASISETLNLAKNSLQDTPAGVPSTMQELIKQGV